MKYCSGCKLNKTLELFGKNQSWCRQCKKEYDAKRWKEQPELRKEYAKQYNLVNPRRRKEIWFKWRYGIELVQQEKMLKDQGGLCKVCNDSTKLYVDHNHTTKEVRGLLCHNCNVALGFLKEDIKRCEKLIEYIKSFKKH